MLRLVSVQWIALRRASNAHTRAKRYDPFQPASSCMAAAIRSTIMTPHVE